MTTRKSHKHIRMTEGKQWTENGWVGIAVYSPKRGTVAISVKIAEMIDLIGLETSGGGLNRCPWSGDVGRYAWQGGTVLIEDVLGDAHPSTVDR
jgi:hypothetical protein